MEHYYSFGFNEFLIASGYKSKVIKEYFKKNKNPDWIVDIVNTGLKTMTGGRLKD